MLEMESLFTWLQADTCMPHYLAGRYGGQGRPSALGPGLGAAEVGGGGGGGGGACIDCLV